MKLSSFGLVLGWLLFWLGNASAAELAGSRPNIILVITDDQGYGDLSCHGNPILKTPHLDRLHGQSLRLTNFHVSPTCAPTRSALLTGRHEFRNGVTHTINERERLTLKATTLPQVLKSAGYATGIFGKWHLGDEPAYWPDKRGFDEMFTHGAGGIGQTYAGSCGDAPNNRYTDPAILHNGTFVKTKGYCTDVFFGQAMQWIKARQGQGPFYCHIATNAPHAPLDCLPEHEARYPGLPPMQAKFFGMIANIDDNVGKLLASLNEWGLDKNTLLIFMTDNGGTVGCQVFNAGQRAQKGTPYQGGVRVPSFWRWPGTLPPGDAAQLTAHLDFFPTLAALAGATLSKEVQGQIEGRSLLPILANPQADWPERTLVTHVGRWERGQAAGAKYRQCAIRNSRFNLLSAAKDGGKSWELFDLQTDPGETRNVLDQHPETARALEAAYDRWWESIPPSLVNENLDGPQVNPFRELYWRQFPDEWPKP